MTDLEIEMRDAIRGLLKASDEVAAEFIQRKRAANWGIINKAYLAAEKVLAKSQ